MIKSLVKMQMLKLILATASVLLSNVVSLDSTEDSKLDQQQERRIDKATNHLSIINDNERSKVIADLELNLLSMLGFTERPRPQCKNCHVPESLKQLYKRQSVIGVSDFAKKGINVGISNTVRTFVHVKSEIDSKFKSTHRFRLYFNISSIPVDEHIHAAELSLNRVAFQQTKQSNDDTDDVSKLVKLKVYDIIRPGVKYKSKAILRLIDNKILDVTSNTTVSLDVYPAVERWLSQIPDESQNHGLLVKLIGEITKPTSPYYNQEHIRLRRNFNDKYENWQKIRPILYVYTNDGHNKISSAKDIIDNRERRGVIQQNRRKNGRANCRRHSLYIDFADVGWDDWIVAPAGYDAYYCHGDCPFPLADHLNTTNHAIIQNIVHSSDSRLATKTCCTPTELGSVSILYFDNEDKAILKNYKDMTVLGCGCH